MKSILEGKLKIKNLENDLSYIENIFWKNSIIDFWDKNKITKKDNYFSLIIWKNGIWKSSFLNYIINYFNKFIEGETSKLMYITFSAFDDVSKEKKEEINYIYNWLKSKTHWAVKTNIYNENKLKILKYLEIDKIKKFINFINYLYLENKSEFTKIVINISYICNDFFYDLDKIKFNEDIKSQFFRLIKEYNINILTKNDMETVEKYWFYDSHIKNIHIFKISNILYLYIFNKLNKRITSLKETNFKVIEDELSLIIKKIDFETILKTAEEEKQMFNGEADFEFAYKELNQDIEYIKTSLNLYELFYRVNWLRKYNSWDQLIKISFWYKEDLNTSWDLIFNYDINNNFSYNDFSHSSSWELTLLYTFLHLSDFQGFLWKKIVLIDEPEISLHPQWQRDYIEKLNDWLNVLWINNVFFIITTHSPLILLSSNNEWYNMNVYNFIKKDSYTISEKVYNIETFSVDELLSKDFWVKIISTNQENSIKDRYNTLLNNM